jgi:hypothetical protein
VRVCSYARRVTARHDPSLGVSVKLKDGDHEVVVSHRFSSLGMGFSPVLGFSAQRAPYGALGGDFDESVRKDIGRRRREGGVRKGRVLYLGTHEAPIAVLAIHIPSPSDPIVVLTGAVSKNLASSEHRRALATLLTLARSASDLLDRSPAGHVDWAVRNDTTAKAVKVLGFKKVARPTHWSDPGDCYRAEIS